jgi:hypothetical protein
MFMQNVYNSLYYKLKTDWNCLKTLSGSSPDTDLSNNITLSQFQSRAALPLRAFPIGIEKTVAISVHFPGKQRVYDV